MTFARGEIVWLSFSPQKGHEQAGRRPALVISPKEYNALSNCILVCPITSNTHPWPWKVILPEEMETKGAVLVDQIESVDVRARKMEPTGQTVSVALMNEILARLSSLIR